MTSNKNETLILIPARFKSTRFPAKLLAEVGGKSIIRRVLENMLKTGFDVAVVTDHDDIEKHLADYREYVVRVDDDVPSGSERIGLAYERYFANKGYRYIINVQGDEPLLVASELIKLNQFHQQKNDYDVCTMVKSRQRTDQDFNNPNVVKVAYFPNIGLCSYFSRASIPYDRDGKSSLEWFQHIGVYCYKVESLLRFIRQPLSSYEDCEKLEQLRGLEMGMRYGAVETTMKLIGVDTPEDLEKLKEVIHE